MILESGKLYRVTPYTEGRGYPVLEIQGTAQVYISLDPVGPVDANGDADLSKMIEVTSETHEGANSLIGLIRYIAVVYASGSLVKESGIVTSVKANGHF